MEGGRLFGAEYPVVQAGMGGGIARHGLAATVSDAGGLGTIGFLPPSELAYELAEAQKLTPAPVAVNLLLPFTRADHWRVAQDASVVVTFWGRPRRRTPRPWVHQVGSVEEALEAHAAGADAVIAQGIEAGGHVRGKRAGLSLLDALLRALPKGFPVLLAGGIANGSDARVAMETGAAGVVLGTRFLVTQESSAHHEYKRALVEAHETILTELFGLGWPVPHRVVANEATRRWLRGSMRGPHLMRVGNRLSAPVVTRLPDSLQDLSAKLQHPAVPMFGPLAPSDDRPEKLVRCAPLYAGETVRSIAEVRPADDVTRDVAAAL